MFRYIYGFGPSRNFFFTDAEMGFSGTDFVIIFAPMVFESLEAVVVSASESAQHRHCPNECATSTLSKLRSGTVSARRRKEEEKGRRRNRRRRRRGSSHCRPRRVRRDAFMMAAPIRSRRYHAMFQKSLFEGPTARKDTDDRRTQQISRSQATHRFWEQGAGHQRLRLESVFTKVPLLVGSQSRDHLPELATAARVVSKQ